MRVFTQNNPGERRYSVVRIDRVVIVIHNLPENEAMKEVVKEGICCLPCVGIGPDWVFFQFPTYSRSEGIKAQVFLESLSKDEIDFLMRDAIEKTVSNALKPFADSRSLGVEVIPCETVLDSPCLGL